jgi:membrane dipeptidase
MGVAMDDWMLSPTWDHAAVDNTGITLATVADHIDHICQVAGSADHAAIGTDLDGGYGREQAPADMDTIADLGNIPGILGGRGYSEADITKVMSGNWVRLLRAALP